MNPHSQKCLDVAIDISSRLVVGAHFGTHEGQAIMAAAIERAFPAPKPTSISLTPNMAFIQDNVIVSDAFPFTGFPKMARLSREVVITEKIDGTNAQIFIRRLPGTDIMPTHTPIVAVVGDLLLYAGSRTRWIVPGDDNYGFARWVKDNAVELSKLGEGQHFGEWWGSGIQRGYGLPKGEKRFSLFNTSRWVKPRTNGPTPTLEGPYPCPDCCHVVPELGRSSFNTGSVDSILFQLRTFGSVAAPGFMNPEGIVIFHTAAGSCFKKTIVGDGVPKSLAT